MKRKLLEGRSCHGNKRTERERPNAMERSMPLVRGGGPGDVKRKREPQYSITKEKNPKRNGIARSKRQPLSRLGTVKKRKH